MPIAAGIYYYAFDGGVSDTPPIVLIHGAGGHHLYWPPQIRRLPGFRIYAIDLPGHGKSDGHGRQSIHDYAAQLASHLPDLGIHQAIFVGHSMGSAIALTLALQYPKQVAALGVVAGGARLPLPSDLLMQAANPATLPKAIKMLAAASFSPSTDPQLVALAAQRMTSIRPSVLYGDLLACAEFDIAAQLKGLHTPTLVICGEDDAMTPLAYARFLAACIANARLEILPCAGHMVMLEQPQATAAILADFFAQIRYRRG